MRALAFSAIALCGCRLYFDPVVTTDGSMDAKTHLPVPGGTFYRSFDRASDGAYPDMTNPATVSSFELDVQEVTVAQFRVFVDGGYATQVQPPATGSGAHPSSAATAWQSAWAAQLPVDSTALKAGMLCNTYATWTDAAGANEAKPINCVSWYEAQAFCISVGGYLPTEAEWNYAAAGGDEQRAYPWSSPAEDTTIDCGHADYNACPNGTRDTGATPQGNGRWGHVDLGGNVWEWVFDVSAAAYPNPCDDCVELVGSTSRVVRGGSFVSDLTTLRAAHRYQYFATAHNDNVGFRCAYPP